MRPRCGCRFAALPHPQVALGVRPDGRAGHSSGPSDWPHTPVRSPASGQRPIPRALRLRTPNGRESGGPHSRPRQYPELRPLLSPLWCLGRATAAAPGAQIGEPPPGTGALAWPHDRAKPPSPSCPRCLPFSSSSSLSPARPHERAHLGDPMNARAWVTQSTLVTWFDLAAEPRPQSTGASRCEEQHPAPWFCVRLRGRRVRAGRSAELLWRSLPPRRLRSSPSGLPSSTSSPRGSRSSPPRPSVPPTRPCSVPGWSWCLPVGFGVIGVLTMRLRAFALLALGLAVIGAACAASRPSFAGADLIPSLVAGIARRPWPPGGPWARRHRNRPRSGDPSPVPMTAGSSS